MSFSDKKQPKSLADLLAKYDWDKKKYISREFQDYGYRLAVSLDDLKNKSLYIKLAKDLPRAWLEEAKNFVKDGYEVRSKARLFMWRLNQIKQERKNEAKSKDQG
jgi:hypothetical protein